MDVISPQMMDRIKGNAHLLVLLLIGLSACMGPKQEKIPRSILESYNIVWTEQSKDASESMPLVGGDIGCNVWVENGQILMYVQRSGSLSENGEYLKLGRIRLILHPNPFTNDLAFRQELKLRDGVLEIESNRRWTREARHTN